MNGDPTNRTRRKRDPEESQMVSLALLHLRRQAGMTVRQLSEASGQPVAALNRYEEGRSLPRTETLRRIVEAMGATMLDLSRAQQRAIDHGGRDGTLPPDTRTPPPAVPHKAAVRLAQECGKAVAHCALAFMELQAGGWHNMEATTTTGQEGEVIGAFLTGLATLCREDKALEQFINKKREKGNLTMRILIKSVFPNAFAGVVGKFPNLIKDLDLTRRVRDATLHRGQKVGKEDAERALNSVQQLIWAIETPPWVSLS